MALMFFHMLTLHEHCIQVKTLPQCLCVCVSVCVSRPSSWCVPACVRVPGGSTDVGTLCRLSPASPDRSAQCSPPYGNHLEIKNRVCNKEKREKERGEERKGERRRGKRRRGKRRRECMYSHMLSCRTKLAMLLCLKYFGRTSLAKRPWSNTWKLVPVWNTEQSHRWRVRFHHVQIWICNFYHRNGAENCVETYLNVFKVKLPYLKMKPKWHFEFKYMINLLGVFGGWLVQRWRKRPSH